MRHVLLRYFVNYEKEEIWLNEMSAKGLALTDFFFCRYSFVDSAPGEYIYRIELLEHTPVHPESIKYLNFMAESGAEHILSWFRWVYFRRKSESGSFDIYSDIDSRIAHYKRISMLMLCIGIMEFCIGIGQIGFVLNSVLLGKPLAWYLVNLFALVLTWSLGALLLSVWNSVRRKVKKLKQEKNVWE
jgi:hypothetical protein